MKVSAVIIALNEESKIADAIRSVSWADEVLVIDAESTDRTREIAAQLGAKVTVQPWLGFSKQKQFATDLAKNDLILSLDADERVSDELRVSILALKTASDMADGYRISRLSFYMDRPIRHGGWYPDRQLRLFNRHKGRWNRRVIHESIQMEGGSTVKSLAGDLLHFSIDSAEHHNRMIGERYARLGAQQMFDAGKRTSPLRIMIAGPSAFVRSYLLQGGFLDGLPGYCIARFAAHHAYLKHLILWEKQKEDGELK